MKFFKKLATLSMALTFVLGLGALTACKGNDSTATYTNYEFIVLDAEGNKVNDGFVQLCTADGSQCFNPIAITNGECVYTAVPNNTLGEYDVHVLNANYETLELKEAVLTSATAFGEYTIQLAE